MMAWGALLIGFVVGFLLRTWLHRCDEALAASMGASSLAVHALDNAYTMGLRDERARCEAEQAYRGRGTPNHLDQWMPEKERTSMSRWIFLSLVAFGVAVGGSIVTAEALPLGGVTAPISKLESLLKADMLKGKPCTCHVPPEWSGLAGPVLLGGKYRANGAVDDEDYVAIPLANCPGATCYNIGISPRPNICDVKTFQPYTALPGPTYSCQQTDEGEVQILP